MFPGYFKSKFCTPGLYVHTYNILSVFIWIVDKINYICIWVVKLLSHVQLFVTLWTVVHQAPLSMEFSRQDYWSKLPFPSPGDLPDPGIELMSPKLQADSLPSESPKDIWYIVFMYNINIYLITGMTYLLCEIYKI